MIDNARRVESHLRDSLANVPGIVAIHGKGCLLGIEFTDKCGPTHLRLLDKKIITGTSSDPKVLRLLPPLCVSIEDVNLFIDELAQDAGSASTNV